MAFKIIYPDLFLLVLLQHLKIEGNQYVVASSVTNEPLLGNNQDQRGTNNENALQTNVYVILMPSDQGFNGQ